MDGFPLVSGGGWRDRSNYQTGQIIRPFQLSDRSSYWTGSNINRQAKISENSFLGKKTDPSLLSYLSSKRDTNDKIQQHTANECWIENEFNWLSLFKTSQELQNCPS